MKRIAGIDGAKGGWLCVSGYEDNHKELSLEKFEYFSDICLLYTSPSTRDRG